MHWLPRAPAPTSVCSCRGIFQALVARPPLHACCRAVATARALPAEQVEATTSSLHEDSSVILAQASSSTKNPAAELDEAELARRRKISEANSGKVPWNKGRKHSPETIAKIKARTAEAMKSPEYVEKFKKAMERRQQVHTEETRAKIGAKVRAYVEAKRIREGKPPKPEKPATSKRRTRSKVDNPDAQTASSDPAPGQEALDQAAASATKPARRGLRKAQVDVVAVDEQQGEQSAPAAKKTPKVRTCNSEAHKQAIREAIREKWKDPVYREHMCQKMKEAAQRRMAKATTSASSAPGEASSSGRSSGRSTSRAAGNSSSNGASSSSTNPLQTKQQQQAWLQQVQGLVEQLLSSKKLLETMDSQVAGMRAQAGAFVNDPVMLDRLESVMLKVEARRQQLADGVAAQQAKIPANVGFDHLGRVYVKPEVQLSASPSPATVPAPVPSTFATPSVASAAQLLGQRISSRPEPGLFTNGLSVGDQALYNSLRGRIGDLEGIGPGLKPSTSIGSVW